MRFLKARESWMGKSLVTKDVVTEDLQNYSTLNEKTKEYLKDNESYLDYTFYLDDDFHPSYMDDDFRESDGFYCACRIR